MSKIPTLNAGMLMNDNVRTLSPDLTLAEAIDFLLQYDVSCAPVVTNNQQRSILVGLLTEKDCIDRVADEFYFGNPRPINTVFTAMKPHPICVSPELDLFSLISLFVGHGLRHTPVTEEDGHILGLVSRRDLLRALNAAYDRSENAWRFEHFPPNRKELANLRFFSRWT